MTDTITITRREADANTTVISVVSSLGDEHGEQTTALLQDALKAVAARRKASTTNSEE